MYGDRPTQYLIACSGARCTSDSNEQVDYLVASDTQEGALLSVLEASVGCELLFDIIVGRAGVSVQLHCCIFIVCILEAMIGLAVDSVRSGR